MDSNLYISALQRQPCLLKTNSTRVLVTWLVTLVLIICPSSYKARLNNLIGTADIEPQIISPQWSNARLNFPTKKIVGGAKFGLVSRLLSFAPPPPSATTPPLLFLSVPGLLQTLTQAQSHLTWDY